jgi:acyl-coenzyme A synthetase/AMP-(fatty) acid ligase
VLYIHTRWKGENVATAEVESVIINVIGLKDAAVYGVEVNTLLNFTMVIHKL